MSYTRPAVRDGPLSNRAAGIAHERQPSAPFHRFLYALDPLALVVPRPITLKASLGTSSVIFAVSPGNSLYELTSAGGSMRLGGFISQISATTDAAGNAFVFVVTTNDAFARFDNQTGWHLLGAPGTVVLASAGQDSGGRADAFVVTADGSVFEFRGSSGWTAVPTPPSGKGTIVQLSAVDRDRVVALANDHSVEEFDPQRGWFALTSPGFAQSISAVSDGGNVVTFAVTLDNALFMHENATGWSGVGATGTVQLISAGTDVPGHAFVAVLTTGNDVSKFSTVSGWSVAVPASAMPANTPVQLSATAADRVFLTYDDGSIFGEDASQGFFNVAGPGFAAT